MKGFLWKGLREPLFLPHDVRYGVRSLVKPLEFCTYSQCCLFLQSYFYPHNTFGPDNKLVREQANYYVPFIAWEAEVPRH